MLKSPGRPTVAPVPTTTARLRSHHKRRFTNVPIPSGITRQKFQQPYHRTPVLKPIPSTILSTQQSPMVSTKPLEILAAEAIRIVYADGKEEESEAVTEHEGSHQDVAPRQGARQGRLLRVVGHVVSCSPFAMSAFQFEHSVLRTLATRKHYQQTLEHFLIRVAKRILCTLNNTDGYSSYNFTATPITCPE